MSRDESADTTGLREHDCATCRDCIHDGNRCCGCYDGVCCHDQPEPDAGDVEALADLLALWLGDYAMESPRGMATIILTESDWLANHVAAAREADRAEVERLTRLAGDRFKDRARERERREAAEERLAGLVAKIEALADEIDSHDYTPECTDGGHPCRECEAAAAIRALIPADAATDEATS